MIEAVFKMMKAGLVDFNSEDKKSDRKTWVTKHPGQVVATIS
jgi:hypothetical protein